MARDQAELVGSPEDTKKGVWSWQEVSLEPLVLWRKLAFANKFQKESNSSLIQVSVSETYTQIVKHRDDVPGLNTECNKLWWKEI